ncbi:NADH-quinone oxidoreductase subunit G [Winkia sp. UMB6473-AN360BR]|uniref:NADH-quinone oxidoreductase subunit G n=1 Tax=Winkia TaxID=2692118 RepID=UPI0014306B53|nr:MULTISPECIES: NADH-quinone oxidoreductase subunit G [Winkia]MDK7185283.1 NADH-quinone oxidoreductase subunit G [Winkia sp. UMB1295B]MDK8816336.1 NADH-quinone oxidoreductase subunit G [Winkia sp. UMB6473-AN360BR]NJJ15631.1 NADH-quinone oxidoreductase subunit G [Winkia neuii]WEB72257.1 NADH-quinone oxidoreductase subunit G [Winkia neuii]
MSEASELITIQIDGQSVEVPKGTLIIRAAEKLGIHIPRFCDHPLLDPAGACRQCLVEVAMPNRSGEVSKMPKPQPACTMTVAPKMEVFTQRTSDVAKKAQHGIMEFLLINHPLDCPICDKGGECPLQNQAMSHGQGESRFGEAKRTFPKPVSLSSTVLLDRDRCILCQRCVRFQKQIAGDPFIDLQGRGGGSSPRDHHVFMGEQIGRFDTKSLGIASEDCCGSTAANASKISGPSGQAGAAQGFHTGQIVPADEDQSGRRFSSYFAGNVIQICPVGALTSATYRFRARPFDLVSTPAVTEHDASGAVIRNDVRRGNIVRRLAGRDMDVNEEWISDKDRFAYQWQFGENRLSMPLVREDGKLVPTSWADAFDRAAQGLAKAKNPALLPGGRLTFEDAFAWSKFARVALRTNNVDARFRTTGAEEEAFLASSIAGSGLDVTYADIDKSEQVLLVGLEPEDECATLFLRLRKASRKGLKVATVAPIFTNGSAKMGAVHVPAAPGTEPEVLASIQKDAEGDQSHIAEGLTNGVIFVGERAAQVPGLLTETVKLAERTGAKLAWVPRRAGERGALEAGLVPSMLPFGRAVADPAARASLEQLWDEVPAGEGLDLAGILQGASTGEVDALVVGGVDTRDLPGDALAAIKNAGFVVSLEVLQTPVTQIADVVLPVAPVAEKAGTFINWEGRLRPFGQALSTPAMSDREVLDQLATELERPIAFASLRDVHAEANQLMNWEGKRALRPHQAPAALAAPGAGQAVLATHKPLLDHGVLLTGNPALAGSARRSVVWVPKSFGIAEGARVDISTEAGTITLPAHVCDMVDRVVWLPQCSDRSHVYETLGVGSGAVVSVTASEVTR